MVVLYPINTLVLELSNGSYINAGLINLPTLTWTDFVLVNSWTAVASRTPQYAISSDNILYVRGALNNSSATASIFTNLTMGITAPSLESVISDCDTTTPVFSEITFSQTNTIAITEYTNGNGIWSLDSVNPISLR